MDLFQPRHLSWVNAEEGAPDAWGVRCSLLLPDPAQRDRLEEIRANLHDRIAEAEREGWPGEVDGLKVSLVGADDKLTQIDAALRRQAATVQLGMPAFPDTVPRSATTDH